MDTLKVEIQKKVIQFISENGLWEIMVYLSLIILLLLGIGTCIGWLLKELKAQAEIKKNITESQKNAIETAGKRLDLLERTYEYRDDYENSTQVLSLNLREVFASMRERDPTGLDNNREEAVNVFYNEFIVNFNKYFEVMESILLNYEKEEFVRDQVASFLNTTIEFLTTVNLDFILELTEREPALLNKSTLNHICRV